LLRDRSRVLGAERGEGSVRDILDLVGFPVGDVDGDAAASLLQMNVALPSWL
jgi:hypothetical protein